VKRGGESVQNFGSFSVSEKKASQGQEPFGKRGGITMEKREGGNVFCRSGGGE